MVGNTNLAAAVAANVDANKSGAGDELPETGAVGEAEEDDEDKLPQGSKKREGPPSSRGTVKRVATRVKPPSSSRGSKVSTRGKRP